MLINDYSIERYFGVVDITAAIIWLLILFTIVLFKSSFIEDKSMARNYRLNFIFKAFFALCFSIYYIFVLNGGDTLAYWDGAQLTHEILKESTTNYLNHMYDAPSIQGKYFYFNPRIGYPPSWIYSEKESYFVCKVTSIVSFFSFKSYLATTFIYAFLLSEINWKIYVIAKNLKLFKEKYLAIAMLFIPSVSFWCTGISKDTIVLISLLYCFYYLHNILIKKDYNILNIIGLFFFTWLLMKVRSFMIITIILPIISALFINFIQKIESFEIMKHLLKGVFLTSTIGIILLSISTQTSQSFIENNDYVSDAVVTQQDFQNNEIYGKNRYSLGEIDFTPIGILKAIPISIFSGLYQPLPWNALSISLLLNGIESLTLLLLLFYWIRTGQFFKLISQINKNKILFFILVFVLIVALISGFTSIIFGVLVRIRAPLLPFFAI